MPTRARWDLTWTRRPSEEASNFNPAFCGEIIYRTAAEYFRARELPFSLALTFLVLPIILHKPTRDQLPKKANAMFVAWAAEHRPVLAGLPDRATRLLPVTREALLFLLQNGVTRIQRGGVVAGEKPIRLSAAPTSVTDETRETRRSAGLLGRWFANQGQPASIMQALGVTL
jgi:ABC-3C biological conflict system middle component